MRQFWKAAGADRYILERSTYSDQIKYLCLGGIVLATGVMAGLAGGYAFYTIFEPKGFALQNIETVSHIGNPSFQNTHIPTMIEAIIFGAIWGLIIFNIDRFIVTSTGKGDGTEAITKEEFRSALPRIVMGIIIAVTISKPVEIRMFKTEIDVALYQKQKQLELEQRRNTEAKYDSEIREYDAKIALLRDEYRAKEKLRDEMMIDLQEEVQGESGSGRRGDGPAAQTIRLNLAQIDEELSLLKQENLVKIEEYQILKNELRGKKDSERNMDTTVAAGLDGLLERIKIAHEIAPWITLFITLLFLAIELTPIFFKLMLIKGPYDYIEDNIKELIKAENGIEVKREFFKDKKGQERDLIIYHKADQAVTELGQTHQI